MCLDGLAPGIARLDSRTSVANGTRERCLQRMVRGVRVAVITFITPNPPITSPALSNCVSGANAGRAGICVGIARSAADFEPLFPHRRHRQSGYRISAPGQASRYTRLRFERAIDPAEIKCANHSVGSESGNVFFVAIDIHDGIRRNIWYCRRRRYSVRTAYRSSGSCEGES